jgi:hypothetical protein
MIVVIYTQFLEEGETGPRLVRRPLFGLTYQNGKLDGDGRETFYRIIVKGNQSTRRKPAPVPPRPSQLEYSLEPWPLRQEVGDGPPHLWNDFTVTCKQKNDYYFEYCLWP